MSQWHDPREPAGLPPDRREEGDAGRRAEVPEPPGYPEDRYPGEGYAAAGYPETGYPAGRYTAGGYPGDGYPEDDYPDDGHPAGSYAAGGYPGDSYPPGSYTAGGYPDDGYPGHEGGGSWSGPGQTWTHEDQQGSGATRGFAAAGPAPRSRRRWPGTAAVAVAAALAAAVMTIAVMGRGGPPAARPATSPASAPAASSAPARTRSPAPAVTRAMAGRVLKTYLDANNRANSARSSAMLAKIEGGASYLMDAGAYRWARAEGAASSGYKPITLASPGYYVPAGQHGFPQWFAVSGQWTSMDGSTAGLDAAWLIFARASAGAPWLQVLEPDILPALAGVRIATDRDGYAEQVNPAAAGGLAASPATLADLTARHLDGSGAGLSGLAIPGNLQDLKDEQFWLPKLPGGSVSDRHRASGGPVFALRTTGGGALVFYSLSADLTLTAPPGSDFHLQIPGYYSAGQAESSARVPYVDQLATYIPPQGQPGTPVVIADVGGVASQR